MKNLLLLKSNKTKEKEIYDLYAEKMYFLCNRYVNNMMDAEEVLHNGFMKVFKHLHSFIETHERSFEFWIKRIMVNESLMHLRKKVNFNLVSIDDIKEKDFEAGIMDDNSSAEQYLKIINELPIGYKTVFNLFAIEGYDHSEIADLLKIAESTSRSQLTKARKMIQQKITKIESKYA